MSGDELFLVGVVASALVFLLKMLAKRGMQLDLGRGWLTVILFVVCVPLALWIEPQGVPVFPLFSGEIVGDVGLGVEYLAEMVRVLAQIVGVSVSVYNVLLKKIFDQMGMG